MKIINIMNGVECLHASYYSAIQKWQEVCSRVMVALAREGKSAS